MSQTVMLGCGRFPLHGDAIERRIVLLVVVHFTSVVNALVDVNECSDVTL